MILLQLAVLALSLAAMTAAQKSRFRSSGSRCWSEAARLKRRIRASERDFLRPRLPDVRHIAVDESLLPRAHAVFKGLQLHNKLNHENGSPTHSLRGAVSVALASGRIDNNEAEMHMITNSRAGAAKHHWPRLEAPLAGEVSVRSPVPPPLPHTAAPVAAAPPHVPVAPEGVDLRQIIAWAEALGFDVELLPPADRPAAVPLAAIDVSVAPAVPSATSVHHQPQRNFEADVHHEAVVLQPVDHLPAAVPLAVLAVPVAPAAPAADTLIHHQPQCNIDADVRHEAEVLQPVDHPPAAVSLAVLDVPVASAVHTADTLMHHPPQRTFDVDVIEAIFEKVYAIVEASTKSTVTELVTRIMTVENALAERISVLENAQLKTAAASLKEVSAAVSPYTPSKWMPNSDAPPFEPAHNKQLDFPSQDLVAEVNGDVEAFGVPREVLAEPLSTVGPGGVAPTASSSSPILGHGVPVPAVLEGALSIVPAELYEGTTVLVSGVSAARYNKRLGTLLKFDNPSGRWQVRFWHDLVPVLFKAEKLITLPRCPGCGHEIGARTFCGSCGFGHLDGGSERLPRPPTATSSSMTTSSKADTTKRSSGSASSSESPGLPCDLPFTSH